MGILQGEMAAFPRNNRAVPRKTGGFDMFLHHKNWDSTWKAGGLISG